MLGQGYMSPSLVWGGLFVLSFVVIRAYRVAAQLRTRDQGHPGKPEVSQRLNLVSSLDEKPIATSGGLKSGNGDSQLQEMRTHKDLYFKLQNLEKYPEVLPQARDLLVSMFSETLAAAFKKPECGILSMEQYSRDNLTKFVQTKDDRTSQLWEEYLIRRRAGSPRELFKDREGAKWWLRQVAPVKYVDGAWLGNINKITTPFALRRATKIAWQVLSEELGDGDVKKNHVQVYSELLDEIETGLPKGDSADFIHPRHDLNEPVVWKAAVSQLLISLFPHEFLPEILGFNMHFEALTLETLTAAKELEELKFNAYYFFLHITIDNGDSGHTMMAMQSVFEYFDHIQETQGSVGVEQAWRRFQAGYILSDNLPTTPENPLLHNSAVDLFPRTEREAEVIKIIQAKAAVAHKIHCSSRLKVGRQALVDWLDPAALASKSWQMEFLDELSNVKPWIRKGNSSTSKLIQELSWGGKMFGSFTQNEVEVFKNWIDSMRSPDPRFYWSFSRRTEAPSSQIFPRRDVTVDYPVFSPISTKIPFVQPMYFCSPSLPLLGSPLDISGKVDISKLLPLWFVHPCLLESFVCVPCKTINTTACSVIRLLRAQAGFGVEGPGVDGMDEARRTDSVGLVELGFILAESSGLSRPASIHEALATWPSEFSLTMLHLSMRPMANAALLLGLAWAFAALHNVMACSAMLSDPNKEILMQIARRERDSLAVCLGELKSNESEHAKFYEGYNIGRVEIEKCFGQW